ncbi:hypothetical protein M413DRAFT_190850 [Hebeloma cylindrosporum]|uniref:Uncharacterized protein n=1 Tax=Hebeloma cylindrosporum TaxID=76867 RepID=A0A0C3C742_HEBCY|nr:hypothetical protein M413DRAFT_190850 [Hebeloma cylindrosporum h7]
MLFLTPHCNVMRSAHQLVYRTDDSCTYVPSDIQHETRNTRVTDPPFPDVFSAENPSQSHSLHIRLQG